MSRLGHAVVAAPMSGGGASVLRGARILVVEDNVMLATEVIDVLSEAGCVVLGPAVTHDAVEATLAEVEVDAAVVDINLNGAKDYKHADALERCGVPILFLSGYAPSIVPSRLSHCDFLTKPVDFDTLLDTLVAAVELRIATRRREIATV